MKSVLSVFSLILIFLCGGCGVNIYNNDEEKCEFLEADLDGGNDEDE